MAQPERLQAQGIDNRSAKADAALTQSNAQEFVKPEPVEPPAPPVPMLQSVSLPFATLFDLETGTFLDRDSPGITDAFDFGFAFNAPLNASFLVQNQVAVEIAFLDEQPLSSISADDLENAMFTNQFVNMPAENDDTILVRTSEGNVFALGNFNQGENLSVTFDFLLVG